MFEVLNIVFRINRKVTIDKGKVEYLHTKFCVVSFNSQIMPKYITINKILKEVEPYTKKYFAYLLSLRSPRQTVQKRPSL